MVRTRPALMHYYHLSDTYLLVVAALSGPGGATLRIFDALKGHLFLEKQLHEPAAGRLMDPNMGTATAFLADDDLLVLTNAHEVRRLSRTTGELIWAWTASDQTYAHPSHLMHRMMN